MEDIKNQKWNPHYRSGLLKILPKGQGVWNKHCKTKQTHWVDDNCARGRVKTLWEENPPRQQPRVGLHWQAQDKMMWFVQVT